MSVRKNENTRTRAAFALAITGDNSSVELLREMAKKRDSLSLRDCRKNNQQRGCMAIYLLGRLGDEEIVDTLIEIISSEDEPNRSAYNIEHTNAKSYLVGGFNNQYFQFATITVMTLTRIADSHQHLQKKIAEAFRKFFENDTYYEKITTRPKMSSEGGMAIQTKNVAFGAIRRWNI